MDEILSVILLLLFIIWEGDINYMPGGAKFLNTGLHKCLTILAHNVS
jgi:hypothetical protein